MTKADIIIEGKITGKEMQGLIDHFPNNNINIKMKSPYGKSDESRIITIHYNYENAIPFGYYISHKIWDKFYQALHPHFRNINIAIQYFKEIRNKTIDFIKIKLCIENNIGTKNIAFHINSDSNILHEGFERLDTPDINNELMKYFRNDKDINIEIQQHTSNVIINELKE